MWPRAARHTRGGPPAIRSTWEERPPRADARRAPRPRGWLDVLVPRAVCDRDTAALGSPGLLTGGDPYAHAPETRTRSRDGQGVESVTGHPRGGLLPRPGGAARAAPHAENPALQREALPSTPGGLTRRGWAGSVTAAPVAAQRRPARLRAAAARRGLRTAAPDARRPRRAACVAPRPPLGMDTRRRMR